MLLDSLHQGSLITETQLYLAQILLFLLDQDRQTVDLLIQNFDLSKIGVTLSSVKLLLFAFTYKSYLSCFKDWFSFLSSWMILFNFSNSDEILVNLHKNGCTWLRITIASSWSLRFLTQRCWNCFAIFGFRQIRGWSSLHSRGISPCNAMPTLASSSIPRSHYMLSSASWSTCQWSLPKAWDFPERHASPHPMSYFQLSIFESLCGKSQIQHYCQLF